MSVNDDVFGVVLFLWTRATSVANVIYAPYKNSINFVAHFINIIMITHTIKHEYDNNHTVRK